MVRHHHGRKEADFAKLMASYDAGRGAYFAKYVLRPDSRRAYLGGWVRGTFTDLHRGRLTTLRRELTSARDYLKARGANGALVLGAPAAIAAFVALYAAIAGNKAVSLLRKPSGGTSAA